MLKTLQHKKAILEALEQSLGVVTTACKKVGISRRTFYDWMQKDKEFAKDVKDIEDIALDFAESKLHQQIQKGDTTATIFYLKTKGKKRGYIERIENVLDIPKSEIKIITEGEEPEIREKPNPSKSVKTIG